MASTLIADIIVPEVFSPYVRLLSEEKSKFVQSGILTPSPELTAFLAGGGMTYNMPSWQQIANTEEKIASEAIGSLEGGTGITPEKIDTFNEIAIRLTRTQQWGASQLSKYLSGEDPMSAVANFVGEYEALRLQALTLAILAGVFADNDAAPAGGDTHTAGDLTFDASGAGFVAGVTNFTAENLFDAQQTAGDSQDNFKVLAVHSAVYNRMKKNNLIDFKQDSETGANLATFQDLRVVFDDGMPKTGNVYSSYLFAPGALEIGWGNVERATSVAWQEDAGNGLGGEVLFRRWMNCVHPMGHAYVGSTTASGGPSNTTLTAAASWSRRCPERKQVKLARLITREA
jgi:hypothetical protein